MINKYIKKNFFHSLDSFVVNRRCAMFFEEFQILFIPPRSMVYNIFVAFPSDLTVKASIVRGRCTNQYIDKAELWTSPQPTHHNASLKSQL
jgi:hypothetical protein